MQFQTDIRHRKDIARKGMTLVELAMVLVIIGAIIGATMRIRGMLLTSDVTAEVAKISALVDNYVDITALSTTFTFTGLSVDPAFLEGRTKLTGGDFHSELTNSLGVEYWYTYVRCDVDAGTGFLTPNNLGTRVCIAPVDFDTFSTDTKSVINGNSFVYCTYENKVDDRSSNSGNMRYTSSQTATDFNNCTNDAAVRYMVLLPAL